MVVATPASPREVQCQRTRFYLPGTVAEGEAAVCPWCAERETYHLLPAEDATTVAVAAAIDLCRSEFGVDDDGLATAVLLGDGPETVYEQNLQRYNIYLGRESDRWQIHYSGAHEAFHRVCSPGVGGHWGDEMFAVLFSLFYLDKIGEAAHAARNEVLLAEEAQACTPREFFAYTGGAVPGLYGRAFLLGRELQTTVGWEMLTRLAVTRAADGRVDVEQWLTDLPGSERVLARSVLQP
jgi:hypothetical protein